MGPRAHRASRVHAQCTENGKGRSGWCAPPGRNGLRVRGRYWDRTSDLFGVNEARYPCANRPDRDKASAQSTSLPVAPVGPTPRKPSRPGCVVGRAEGLVGRQCPRHTSQVVHAESVR